MSEMGGVAEGVVVLGSGPSGVIQSDPHAGSNRNKQLGVLIYFWFLFLPWSVVLKPGAPVMLSSVLSRTD